MRRHHTGYSRLAGSFWDFLTEATPTIGQCCTLFGFAVARGLVADNPVKATQAVKADDVTIQIFTPTEMRKLLGAASGGFLPSIVLGAFAGLRSAEIKRLTWDDIRLAERHIVVGKDKAKTASRRIVPIWENCATWLAPYAGHAGAVWGGD